MSRNHPYKQYERSSLWALVDQAVQDLADNGDLTEQTTREHIVGYICKTIKERSEKGE